VVAIAAGLLGGNDGNAGSILVNTRTVGSDPLAFDPSRSAAYERAAAFGLSHVLFAKSPGGVARTATRTTRFRPLVEKAVAGTGLDPGIVEAMIFLESAGRPEAIAGRDPAAAAGLTQILAETARNLLGMPVNLAASRRLTRRIDSAETRGDTAAVERLQAKRRKVDARFDPAQAIAGAVRYLKLAEGRFGSSSLAVVSYHMGIGNLQQVLGAYGDSEASYPQLYFDASPDRHPRAYRLLAGLGDDSKTYFWRVLASREVMRLYRGDRAKLDRLAELQSGSDSGELVLHPPDRTKSFESPEDIDAATADGELRPVAGGALRPEAYALLAYIRDGVRNVSGVKAPLTVTKTVRPDASIHATGYAFDISRTYANGRQAEAFQFMLDRLQALNVIAWTRDSRTIHITASSEGRRILGETGR